MLLPRLAETARREERDFNHAPAGPFSAAPSYTPELGTLPEGTGRTIRSTGGPLTDCGNGAPGVVPMGHVILLGDSIFDNASYVPGRPPVVEQVGRSLPPGWQASLLAVDGHVVSDVSHQLTRLP